MADLLEALRNRLKTLVVSGSSHCDAIWVGFCVSAVRRCSHLSVLQKRSRRQKSIVSRQPDTESNTAVRQHPLTLFTCITFAERFRHALTLGDRFLWFILSWWVLLTIICGTVPKFDRSQGTLHGLIFMLTAVLSPTSEMGVIAGEYYCVS